MPDQKKIQRHLTGGFVNSIVSRIEKHSGAAAKTPPIAKIDEFDATTTTMTTRFVAPPLKRTLTTTLEWLQKPGGGGGGDDMWTMKNGGPLKKRQSESALQHMNKKEAGGGGGATTTFIGTLLRLASLKSLVASVEDIHITDKTSTATSATKRKKKKKTKKSDAKEVLKNRLLNWNSLESESTPSWVTPSSRTSSPHTPTPVYKVAEESSRHILKTRLFASSRSESKESLVKTTGSQESLRLPSPRSLSPSRLAENIKNRILGERRDSQKSVVDEGSPRSLSPSRLAESIKNRILGERRDSQKSIVDEGSPRSLSPSRLAESIKNKILGRSPSRESLLSEKSESSAPKRRLVRSDATVGARIKKKLSLEEEEEKEEEPKSATKLPELPKLVIEHLPDRPIITQRSISEIVCSSTDRLRPTSLPAGRRRLPPMSRTMSLIPPPVLPPLYEEDTPTPDASSSATSVAPRPAKRRYGGSHTTSTYQGVKDAAPDASPRRHLIGFLHRTSHLSLTSELSGNASFYLIGHRRHLEESTIASESDARIFSDEDDRGSTTTDFTSVSRQHEKMVQKKKKNRRNFRKPSRASSFSSITESSMSLDVFTVTLNMDTVNFLGISIVGQTSTRGDNGIYVANIMKGGAVALDGRIEAGDMILQVNDISFENFTNDQAVDVLRDAVSRRGPIKLTVAKSFENGPQSCFTIPRNSREEPVRPIDTQAWIQHTNAMRGMPSIVEGVEGAPTPLPGDWPHGRPQSSSTVTSNGSNGQNTVVGNGAHIKLDLQTDKKKIVEVMAMPNSGLDIKNRTWLKIPIPMSFLGSDLVEWLLDHVEGLRERKDARKFAADLLKLKYIAHVVNKVTFTEQCYYVLGDECSDYARFRNEDGGPRYQWTTGVSTQPAASGTGGNAAIYGHQKTGGPQVGGASMVSGYASMPVSPFPQAMLRARDATSQASGSSGGGGGARKRNIILPSKPTSSASGGSASGSGTAPPVDMSASRQSFRAAMSQPYEFFIDKI